MEGESKLEPQESPSRTTLINRLFWGVLILVFVFAFSHGIWSLIPHKTVTPNPNPRAPFEVESLRLSNYGSVPYFSFSDRSGRRISLSDLRSKLWISDFMFTSCPDECSLMSRQMAKLQAEFSRKREKDVLLVSFSIDPQHDTPNVLSHYAERFGADPSQWFFLTGPKAEIYRLAQEGFHLSVLEVEGTGNREQGIGNRIQRTEYRIEDREDREDRIQKIGYNITRGKERRNNIFSVPCSLFPVPYILAHDVTKYQGSGRKIIHSNRFVLVDRQARIRGYYDSNDEKALRQLRQDVRRLIVSE